MGAWILILMIGSSYGGPGVTSVKFPSEMGCEAAGKKAVEQFYYSGVKYLCVENK
jgi:hypothetical protein